MRTLEMYIDTDTIVVRGFVNYGGVQWREFETYPMNHPLPSDRGFPML